MRCKCDATLRRLVEGGFKEALQGHDSDAPMAHALLDRRQLIAVAVSYVIDEEGIPSQTHRDLDVCALVIDKACADSACAAFHVHNAIWVGLTWQSLQVFCGGLRVAAAVRLPRKFEGPAEDEVQPNEIMIEAAFGA